MEYPKIIKFKHPHAYCRDGTSECEGDDDCYSPYVSLGGFNRHPGMENADEIVVPKKIILSVDYPLSRTFEFTYETGPYTRQQLADVCCDLYQRIYKEEEETIKQQNIIPTGERVGLINRNRTDGKYGIWGHDIGDLELFEVRLVHKYDDNYVYELWIDS